MFLLYSFDRWNRLDLIKKSNILQLAIRSFSPSLFILEIMTLLHRQACYSMLRRLTRYLNSVCWRGSPLSAPLSSVGLVLIWLAGNGCYYGDWSIVYMYIFEDQEWEKVSKKCVEHREWFTEHQHQHQQRKGDLQMINNAVGEWQEHIVFCSHSGDVIGFILLHCVKQSLPVLCFLCLRHVSAN